MLIAGIINILLGLAGVYFVVSSGWQATEKAKGRRLGWAFLCWIVAVMIGLMLYVVRAEN